MSKQKNDHPHVRFSNRPSGVIPAFRTIGRQVAPWEDVYHALLSMSWLRFFAVIIAIFFSVNLFFACLYATEPNGIANARSQNVEDAFYFSVQTFATIGYGYMAPVTRWTNALVVVESFSGILLTAVVTGLAFARLSRPGAKVLFSQNAVVNNFNGEPHLMFRMANWRQNNVLEAQLKVILLVMERTQEGHEMRIPIEVPLVRQSSSVFILSWTAMHRITPDSPFFGPDALDRLRARKAEIFLALTGLDETTGQTIHARHRYSLDDVLFHTRFVDVLRVLPDGTRELDYRGFHRTEPARQG